MAQWDIPTMIATMTDDKRRLTMPRELPAKSPVTIHQLDENTWVVKRQQPDGDIKIIALPKIDKLPDDPEWEAIERRMVEYNNRKLPPFEE